MAVVRRARDQTAVQPSVVVSMSGAHIKDTEDVVGPWDQVAELREVFWCPWPEPRATNQMPRDEHVCDGPEPVAMGGAGGVPAQVQGMLRACRAV